MSSIFFEKQLNEMSPKKERLPNVILMCGLPGSGKNSYIQRNFPGQKHVVFDADSFFVKDGVYTFDHSKLGQAHEKCFENFVNELMRSIVYPPNEYVIVVANTNTQLWEMSPYVAITKFFEASFKIVKLECSVETSMKRNTHNVPEKAIIQMKKRLDNLRLPDGWPVEVVNSEDK